MPIVCPRPVQASLRLFSLMVAISLLATPAYAAPGGYGDAGISTLLWPVLNVTLYALLLRFLYKKLGRPALKSRSLTVKTEMQQAAQALLDVNAQLDTLQHRLAGMAEERADIVAELQAEGKVISAKTLVLAQEAVESGRRDVEWRISGELKKAESEIRSAVVTEASKRVRESLLQELSYEDDLRLRREALHSIR